MIIPHLVPVMDWFTMKYPQKQTFSDCNDPNFTYKRGLGIACHIPQLRLFYTLFLTLFQAYYKRY